MWVGEVLDAEHKVVQEYFLRGPSIKIGRSVENSLVFSADKSISRVHAEIMVDSSTGNIQIVDLASRYGSSANGVKIQANVPFQVDTGVIARFGVGSVRIRLVKRYYSFCTTRLEKTEKDRLKRCVKAMNCRMVTQTEHATHVVCNKAAATVKLLAALVMPLKLIALDWINFVEGSKAAELIPKEEDFAPAASDDIVIHDSRQSRSALLQGYTIFLLNAFDQQYLSIGTACGASVVQCYALEEETGLSALTIISRHILQQLQDPLQDAAYRRFCLFFDESRGIDCDKLLMSECRDEVSAKPPGASRDGASLSWLTAGQLAAAIINFTAPTLFADPPRAAKVAGGGHSCSQSQLSGGLHSQYHAVVAHVSRTAYSQQLPLPIHTASTNSNLAKQSSTRPATVVTSAEFTGVTGKPPLSGVHPTDASTTSLEALNTAKQPSKQVSRRVSMQETCAEGMATAATRSITPALHTAVQDDDDEEAAQLSVTIAPVYAPVKVNSTVALEPAAVDLPAPAFRQPALAPAEVPTVESTATAAPQAVLNKRGRSGNTKTTPLSAAVAPMEEPAAATNTAEGRRKLAEMWDGDEGPTAAGPSSTSAPRGGRGASSRTGMFTVSEDAAEVRADEDDDVLFVDAPAGKRARVKDTVPTVSEPAVAAALLTTKPALAVSSAVVKLTAAPPAQRPPTSSARRPPPPLAAEDGLDWIPALRGEQRTQVLQTKKTHASAHSMDVDGEEGDADQEEIWKPLPQPEVVETLVLLASDARQQTMGGAAQGPELACSNTYRGYYRLPSSSERVAVQPAGAGVRNVKLFRKNSVTTAQAGDKMSFSAMQVVLPKESEREIQLRLEAEARQEMEKYADQMLSDKFTAQAIRKVFSKA